MTKALGVDVSSRLQFNNKPINSCLVLHYKIFTTCFILKAKYASTTKLCSYIDMSGLTWTIFLPVVVLIAQAVFLASIAKNVIHRLTVTDTTHHPTHAMATAGVGNDCNQPFERLHHHKARLFSNLQLPSQTKKHCHCPLLREGRINLSV